MMQPNLTRMLEIIDTVFQTNSDPNQLNIDETIIEGLKSIHPSTVTELANEDGPYMWMIVIPSTQKDMQEFLEKKIHETELYERASGAESYDALYLCSAITLPEFRNQGLSKQTILDAIRSIMNDYPIKSLFVWNFSKEGDHLSSAIAEELNLPLFHRQ